MSTTKRKRLFVVTAGTLSAVLLYLAVYFACVTVHYRHNPAFKEQSMQEAYALYRLGPLSQDVAHYLFRPAQLCDALYLRPTLWQDRQQAAAR